MSKYLSFSRIRMALGCGMQYYFAYIEEKKRRPSFSMVRGGACHTGVEVNMRHRMDTLGPKGKDGREDHRVLSAPEEEISDLTRDKIENEWKEGIELTKEESAMKRKVKALLIDTSIEMTLHHRNELGTSIYPRAVEQPFTLEVEGNDYDIHGFIDLLELDRGILDYKFRGKSPSKTDCYDSDQLTVYAFADHLINGKTKRRPVELHTTWMLKKGPKAKVQEDFRDERDYRRFLMKFERVTQMIDSGIFLPAEEGHWRCSKKWCGYWESDCEFGRRNRHRFVEPKTEEKA